VHYKRFSLRRLESPYAGRSFCPLPETRAAPFYLLTDFPVSEEYAWKVWIEERPWNYAPEGAPGHHTIEWACPKKV
jgi:hypothetical protein